MSMSKEKFVAEVMEMKVFDTHSHLIGKQLAARNFWDIGEYFWFKQELEAAGYPANASELPDEERRAAYARAFCATRNTAMNWAVRRIAKDLYGIEINSADSIKRLDEAVQETARQPGWAGTVADKTNLSYVVVNYDRDADFEGLPGVGVWLPRIDGQCQEWVHSIQTSSRPMDAAERVSEEIAQLLSGYKRRGARGFMTTLPRIDNKTWNYQMNWHASELSGSDIWLFLLDELCQNAEKTGLFFQMFIGMERGWGPQNTPIDEPERIVKLHGLFANYGNEFELVVGAPMNNMDVVQATKLFTNVHAGGLWWYNFRPSTYNMIMQQRFEALTPKKSSLIVSDARCIEWCYGKIILVKKLIAEFLFKQVDDGWIDETYALEIAAEWLHDSAARRYR